MQIGDRVHLTADDGPCSAGDEGIVQFVDRRGHATVEITHRADCTPWVFLLVAVPPERLAAGARCL